MKMKRFRKFSKSITGMLKAALFLRGWRQGPDKFWHHPHHEYKRTRFLGFQQYAEYVLIDGLTLRAAAKREGLLLK